MNHITIPPANIESDNCKSALFCWFIWILDLCWLASHFSFVSLHCILLFLKEILLWTASLAAYLFIFRSLHYLTILRIRIFWKCMVEYLVMSSILNLLFLLKLLVWGAMFLPLDLIIPFICSTPDIFSRLSSCAIFWGGWLLINPLAVLWLIRFLFLIWEVLLTVISLANICLVERWIAWIRALILLHD